MSHLERSLLSIREGKVRISVPAKGKDREERRVELSQSDLPY